MWREPAPTPLSPTVSGTDLSQNLALLLTKVVFTKIILKHQTFICGAGILITSYNQAEIYIPSIRMTFALPSIEGHPRVWHTLTGNVLCGGVYRKTDTSCLELTESGKGWQPYSSTLQQPRLAHSAWNSPEGIVLLGGYDSGNTTELITRTNTSDKFTLKDPIR